MVLPEASELVGRRGGALGIGPPPTGFISIIFLSSVLPEKGLGLCLQEDLPQIDWKYPQPVWKSLTASRLLAVPDKKGGK